MLVVKVPLRPAPGFPGGSVVKNLPANAGAAGSTLGREKPLEKETAARSSILAWDYPTDKGAWRATVHEVTKSWTLSD